MDWMIRETGYRFGDPTQWARTQELVFLTDRLLIGEPPKVWQRTDRLLRFGVSPESIRESLRFRKTISLPSPVANSSEIRCQHTVDGQQLSLYKCRPCKIIFCVECFNIHDFLFHWEEDPHEN